MEEEKSHKKRVRPQFTYFDIYSAASLKTIEKARDIFKSGGVKNVVYSPRFVEADVRGSRFYRVSLSYRDIMLADCDCYAGQQGRMCKHVLALSFYLLNESGQEEKREPPQNLSDFKKLVREAFKRIRPYTGPSRTWFSYTHKLSVAREIICFGVRDLPATKEVCDYLWNLVLRISKRLSYGGVDDSDGALGDAVFCLLEKIAHCAREHEELFERARKKYTDRTGFDFEKELALLLKEKV